MGVEVSVGVMLAVIDGVGLAVLVNVGLRVEVLLGCIVAVKLGDGVELAKIRATVAVNGGVDVAAGGRL